MRTVFDAQGNKIQVPDDVPTNDLTRAPIFNDDLPENTLYSVVVVPSKDGTPMLALVNPTLLATTEEVLERISVARQELVDAGIARDNALAAEQVRINALVANETSMLANMQAVQTSLADRKQPIPLSNVVIPASALITLSVTELVLTRSCPGIRTTDAVSITPVSLPAGYGLRGFSIPANDQITIRVQAPILSVGGSPITFAVTVFR